MPTSFYCKSGEVVLQTKEYFINEEVIEDSGRHGDDPEDKKKAYGFFNAEKIILES